MKLLTWAEGGELCRMWLIYLIPSYPQRSSPTLRKRAILYSFIYNIIVTPRACARSKVLLLSSLHKNRHISRSRHCKHNESIEFSENWLQCASNWRTQCMSITNSAFLLATVAMPIDSAYSMHTHCAFCSCTQLSGHMTGKNCQNILNNARDIHSYSCYPDPLTQIWSPMVIM